MSRTIQTIAAFFLAYLIPALFTWNWKDHSLPLDLWAPILLPCLVALLWPNIVREVRQGEMRYVTMLKRAALGIGLGLAVTGLAWMIEDVPLEYWHSKWVDGLAGSLIMFVWVLLPVGVCLWIGLGISRRRRRAVSPRNATDP